MEILNVTHFQIVCHKSTSQKKCFGVSNQNMTFCYRTVIDFIHVEDTRTWCLSGLLGDTSE